MDSGNGGAISDLPQYGPLMGIRDFVGRRRGQQTFVEAALDPQGIAYRDFGFGGTDPEKPYVAARAFKPTDRPPHVFVMRPFPASDDDEQIASLAFTKHQMVIGEELWFPEFAEMAERCTEVPMHFWGGRD